MQLTSVSCLACRKRRIKCGEEKPTCHNCTKSKRQCEGYNQRVIFKDPLNAYRPSFSTSSHTAFPGPSAVQPGVRHGEVYSQPASGQIPLPLAPKPQGVFRPSKAVDISPMPPLPAATSPGSERRIYNFSDIKGSAIRSETPKPRSPPPFDIQADTVDQSHIPEPRPKHSPRDQATHYDFNALVKQEEKEDAPITPAQISPLDWSAGPSSGFPSYPQELYHDSNRQFPAGVPFYQSYSTATTWETVTTSASVSQSFPAPVPAEISFGTKVDGLPERLEESDQDHAGYSQGWHAKQLHIHNYPPRATEWSSQPSPLEANPPAIVDDEDDPFDVSDDDVTMEEEEISGTWREDVQDGHLRNNDLGIVVALQARQDNQDLSLRSFTSFIDRPDMLATYVPSSQSTPLRDPITARIFCHFVNVTGPSMSLFERHPANPSLMFQGAPVPKSQQNIWACKHLLVILFGPIAHRCRHLPHSSTPKSCTVACNARPRQPPYCQTSEWTHRCVAETLRNRSSQSCKVCQSLLSTTTACYFGGSNATSILRSLVGGSPKME